MAALCMRVPHSTESSESLLSRNVPQLHIELTSAHAHALQSEIDTDRCLVVLQHTYTERASSERVA